MPRIRNALRSTAQTPRPQDQDQEQDQGQIRSDNGIEAAAAAVKQVQLAAADCSVENLRVILASSLGTAAGLQTHLASILGARARILVGLDLPDEALPSVEEELAIRRSLLDADPETELSLLAEALLLRSRILVKAGRSEQARADVEEAKVLLQQAIVSSQRRTEEAKEILLDRGARPWSDLR